MLHRTLLIGLASLVIGISACSSDGEDPDAAPSEPAAAAAGDATPAPPPTLPQAGDEPPPPAVAETDEPPAEPEMEPEPTEIAGAETEPGEAEPTETEPAEPEPAEPAVDVEPILEQLAAYYEGLEGFTVTAEARARITDEAGEVVPISAGDSQIRHLAIQRPNRFSVETDTEDAPVFTSNGEQLVYYLPQTSKYLEQEAPENFAQLLETELGLPLAMNSPTQRIPFILMSEEPLELLMDGVTSKEYAGEEEIDGTPAHRVRITQEQESQFGAQEIVWDLWIAAEGDPVLLQTSFDRGTQPFPVPGEGVKTITISIVERLSDWQFNPELSDDRFLAAIPETANEASDIFDLFEAPPPLLGEEAPEVTLPLLAAVAAEDAAADSEEGSEEAPAAGELNLATHEGEEIVILDFWATWCGPCRAGLPILVEVSEEYKDRGVVFYAVNLEETDEEIRQFLEDEELQMTVAKDADSSVAREFGVSGIPHSVVVGKNGIVQAVHIGFSGDLGDQLRAELDALLAGHDIFDGLPEQEGGAEEETSPESGESEAADDAESTGAAERPAEEESASEEAASPDAASDTADES